jgi:hypothetical protein
MLPLMMSCNHKSRYYYEVRGTVNGKSAIWYLYTYEIKNDTIVYKNYDSTETKIAPPYIIKKLKQTNK